MTKVSDYKMELYAPTPTMYIFTDYFSGSGIAVDSVCLCVYVSGVWPIILN